MMRKIRFQMLVLAGILIFAGAGAPGAFAQVDSGRITGTVVDSTNAPILGALVSVRNERTNEERTATTTDNGSFAVAALKPSLYAIHVSMDQFAPAELTNVQLSVGQQITRRFTLQVASISSSVTVVESAENAVDTSSARMGVNVNLREVGSLPINGRQLSQLYLQAPGSLNSGSGTFGDIRFSGRAVEQNAIRYDGVEGSAIVDASPGNLNGEVPSPFRLQSSLENVQEFRVESNNFPAEYGTGTGGQISVVTKSGSNQFHGSVFEYLRNNAFDARNTFDTPTTPSALRMNQFGASLGGPIVKDKLFFFAYYEGYRLRSGINFIEAVPSAAVRNLPVCSAGVAGGFGTGTNNCVNAATQPLLAGFIGPGALTGPSNDPAFDFAQINSTTRVSENSGGIRLDYSINSKHSLYARYFRDQGFNDQPEGVTGRRAVITAWPQNGALSLVSNLSPNVINEAKFGFNEARTTIDGQAPTINGVDFSAISLSISGNVANAGIAGQGGNSGIASPGGLVRSNSATNGRGQPYTPYTLSFIDSVSWVSGKHNIKFGAEVRLIRFYTDRLGGTTYTYSNLNNFLNNSLQQAQYLGDMSAPSVFNGGFTGNRKGAQEYYIGYIQDEIKLRPNLTVNMGMRYEYYAPMREANDNYVYFDINTGVLTTPDYCQTPTALLPNSNSCSPGERKFYTGAPTAFGPRISVAWSPFSSRTGFFGGDKSVFRAGFGIYYGPGQTEDLLQPIESDRVASTLAGGSTINCPGPVTVTYPVVPSCVSENFANNVNNRSFQPRAYSPEYRVPERIHQYSASWQQQWPGQFVTTVAYVGSQGRNLFLRSWANKIVSVRTNTNPASNAVVVREFDIDQGGNSVLRPYAEVDYKTSGGHDSYNALQTSIIRRSATGLTLSGQYTYSKSFGNTSGSNEAKTSHNPFDFEADTGYNAFDVRHTFNMSALYMLPIGRGKRYGGGMNGAANAIVGNWELGTILNARAGVPLDVTVTRPDVLYVDDSGTYFTGPAAGRTAVINVPGGGASRNVRRPDLIPGVDPYLKDGTFWLNPAAFATPEPGGFGNLQRNLLRGPAFAQVDLTLAKRFPIREAMSLDFRTEIFNVLNHTNFANPSVSLASAIGSTFQPGDAFTQSAAGSSFSKLRATSERTVGLGTNRQIQFSLRLNF